jgi:hypothetical protein
MFSVLQEEAGHRKESQFLYRSLRSSHWSQLLVVQELTSGAEAHWEGGQQRENRHLAQRVKVRWRERGVGEEGGERENFIKDSGEPCLRTVIF